jgi:hypothetical protein
MVEYGVPSSAGSYTPSEESEPAIVKYSVKKPWSQYAVSDHGP